jgi:hypothetical protein
MLFEKNMFADCSKAELEMMFRAIEKDESCGLLTFGYEAMARQIERIQRYLSIDYEKKRFDSASAYNMAQKELYEEISKRYFES